MKTFMKILTLMGIMLLPTTLLFAQGGSGEIPGTFETAFTTFVALVAAIPVVVEFLKNLFGKTKETPDWLVQLHISAGMNIRKEDWLVPAFRISGWIDMVLGPHLWIWSFFSCKRGG